MKYIFSLVMYIVLFHATYRVHAQFVELSHVRGTRHIAGIDVTAVGNDPWFDSVMYCDMGPYYVGAIAPGNFTFTFSRPVPRVRLRFAAMNGDEVMSFAINGSRYMLSSSEFSAFPGICEQAIVIVSDGNLVAPDNTPVRGGGGQVDIATSISTLVVSANGIKAGSNFSLAFDSSKIVSCPIFMPDAFSPNGDGINDEMGPQSTTTFEFYRFCVFNRWGQKIFESHDINDRWDGNSGGNPATIDQYFYYIKGRCLGGVDLWKKGDFLLIK